MNQPNIELRQSKVTLNDILDKVVSVKYVVLDDTTTTVCVVTMKNGFVVLGSSACADPKQFNKALGEQYSYADAIDKVWPLEGYMLREKLFNEK